MVRIPGFHPGDSGSSPGMGIGCNNSFMYFFHKKYLYNNALITSVLWGSMSLCGAKLGKESREGAVFMKTVLYGITSILIFLFFKKEIVGDLNRIWKQDKYVLIIIIIIMFLGASVAQYTYFSALNISENKAHIIITIVHSLPIVFAIFGSYLLFNEPINKFTCIGALLVILGLFIMKNYGPLD